MKISVIIPARSGSKRIPAKNSKQLGGKPLVVWSIETAHKLRLPCYVSTDSGKIALLALEFGAEVIERPPEYCTDTATDYDVIRHAIEFMPGDMIAYLRPTTPFRQLKWVWVAIKIMGHYDYTSLRSVEEMPESAFKCFGRDKNGLLRPLTKRDVTDFPNQKLPKTYHPNGYIDIVRRSVVEQGELWGNKLYGLVTPYAIELDTLEQWQEAERRLNEKATD